MYSSSLTQSNALEKSSATSNTSKKYIKFLDDCLKIKNMFHVIGFMGQSGCDSKAGRLGSSAEYECEKVWVCPDFLMVFYSWNYPIW